MDTSLLVCHVHDVEDSLTDINVSFSFLCHEFGFVGVMEHKLSAQSVHPHGWFLPIYINSIGTFVEEYQFLTCDNLRCLAQSHSLCYDIQIFSNFLT